jgi:hypothetical protein
MVKQIYNIIKNNESDKMKAAEEVTLHICNFIEWLSFGSHPFIPWIDFEDEKLIKFYTDEENDKKYNIEDLYYIWLESDANNE